MRASDERFWLVAVLGAFIALGGTAESKDRLLPSGRTLAVDPSFNGGAVLPITGPAGTPAGSADAVAAMPDGRIAVLAGELLMYRPDGSLDAAYGSAGAAPVYDFLPAETSITGIKALPSGGLLLIGWGNLPYLRPFVMRLRPDGTLDRSWGRGGRVAIPHQLAFAASDGLDSSRLAVRADGFVAVASTAQPDDQRGIEVSLLNRRGQVAKRFGRRGVARFYYRRAQGDGNWLSGIAFDPRGRVVVTGYTPNTADCEDTCPRNFVDFDLPFVARLNSRGRLDRSFSRNGLIGLPGCAPTGISVSRSRGIVIPDSCRWIWRVDSRGRRDSEFSSGPDYTDAMSGLGSEAGDEMIHRNRNGSFSIADIDQVVVLRTSARGKFDAKANVNLAAAPFSPGGSGGPAVSLTYSATDQPIVVVNRFVSGSSGPKQGYLARFAR